MTCAAQTVDPRTDAGWAGLMTSGRGSLFGSPPWIRAVAGTYGFDVAAEVLVDGGGRVTAGLVFADVDDVRGHRLVSFPFSDRFDPVADGRDQWNALVMRALQRRLPFTLRCLEPGPPERDGRFVRTGTAAWHATDLRRSGDDLFAGFSSSGRQNIRRAQRSCVDVQLSTRLDDVRAFHDLHCHLRKRKYRLLAPPLRLFERIWEEFEPTGSIVVALARHEGDLVAGALYLEWDGVLYYKYGASVPERLGARPNELLAWASMRHGLERGCGLYDWGLSDLDQPGLLSFKAKFATEERRIASFQHRPDRAERELGGDVTALLGDLVDLLTRDDVPDEVTRRAGELVYGVFC
jgi:hypothetical protein